ncbi:MAG: S8 family serine peptidase, partial [Actinomycetota bacterium]
MSPISSSRGPGPAVSDVLEPDVSAPGVDVLAAVDTTNPTAEPEFGDLSGTSTSGPPLAGAAAPRRGPRWRSSPLTRAARSAARGRCWCAPIGGDLAVTTRSLCVKAGYTGVPYVSADRTRPR